MDFWQFVDTNINNDPQALRLKYHGKYLDGVDLPLAITQIECRKKFATKLRPILEACPHFLFPNALAGEQATSCSLAQYHCSLVPAGASIVDLTAGLGIDAFTMAMHGHKVHAIELDGERVQALDYNAHARWTDDLVSTSNFSVECGDCREVLKGKYDVAFIDPARRAQDGSRVYALDDCQPDVLSMLPLIREHADTLVIKASPMLDITRLASLIPGCKRIIAIGNARECKELVAIVDCKSTEIGQYSVSAVTILPAETISFDFTPIAEREAQAEYSEPLPGMMLFEPFPATMKAAPFNLLASTFDLKKIQANTHLYLGNDFVDQFPGETLEIWKVYPYKSKYIKTLRLEFPQISVTTRNFEIGADALRQKLKVKDGGVLRLFGITDYRGNSLMVIARPLRNYSLPQI